MISRVLPTYVTAQPKNSVLLLADFTGAKFDKKILESVKQTLVFDRPHVKRSAWVGTAGLPKVFYEHLKSFSQRDLPLFETRAEALEWLTCSRVALRQSGMTFAFHFRETLSRRPNINAKQIERRWGS